MKKENGSSTISKQRINEQLELEFRAAEDFYSASLTTINQDTPPAKYFEAFFQSRLSKMAFLSDICPLMMSFCFALQLCDI